MFLQRHHSRLCRKKHKSITYDANGALLTDGLRHYAYDSEGRLAAASLGWSSAATADDSITKYAHNSQAQRVFKTAPLFAVTNPDPAAPQSTLDAFTAFFESLWSPSTNPDGSTVQKAGMSYVYDEDGTLIADTLTGGAQTSWGQSARYVYLPTASGPMPVAAIYGTKHYAIQSDHLNTPRRLIQSDGQVAWQWAYSAFGEEKPTIAKTRFANADLNQSFGTTTVPAITFNLRYPGQYFDLESSLHYNYHRSYSATIGGYIQNDPIGLRGGWNGFAYSNQNPLSFTDPTGLDVAVITGGYRGGYNFFGHSAVAAQGQGVFSYGNDTLLGSSLGDYLRDQNRYRDQQITFIPTTKSQDDALGKFFTSEAGKNNVGLLDNCAVRTNQGLDAAGLQTNGSPFPGGVARDVTRLPGAETYYIPRGVAIPDVILRRLPSYNGGTP